jgi:hypothetical protein
MSDAKECDACARLYRCYDLDQPVAITSQSLRIRYLAYLDSGDSDVETRIDLCKSCMRRALNAWLGHVPEAQ